MKYVASSEHHAWHTGINQYKVGRGARMLAAESLAEARQKDIHLTKNS